MYSFFDSVCFCLCVFVFVFVDGKTLTNFFHLLGGFGLFFRFFGWFIVLGGFSKPPLRHSGVFGVLW
jgi:hypothetical protein